VASLEGSIPFGQLLATPSTPGKDRFPTLGTQRLRYKFKDSLGNTGYATANTGNLLSVLSLHIIQVVIW